MDKTKKTLGTLQPQNRDEQLEAAKKLLKKFQKKRREEEKKSDQLLSRRTQSEAENHSPSEGESEPPSSSSSLASQGIQHSGGSLFAYKIPGHVVNLPAKGLKVLTMKNLPSASSTSSAHQPHHQHHQHHNSNNHHGNHANNHHGNHSNHHQSLKGPKFERPQIPRVAEVGGPKKVIGAAVSLKGKGTPGKEHVQGPSEIEANSPSSPALDAPLSQFEKRVEKALHGRLYLLRRNGPKAFVVCSEALYKKYRVLLGPQTCSCGRILCVHLLFVMLRVLKVDQNDPLLRNDSLKEYEVDMLLRKAEELRMQTSQVVASPEKKVEGSQGSEAESCPICLLDLGREKDLLATCRNGCGNMLHRHCMEIWASERKRMRESVCCPLCRTEWEPDNHQSTPHSVQKGHGPTSGLPSSKVTTLQPLPTAPEPLSPANKEKSKTWLAVFSHDLLECLFSKHWSHREKAVRTIDAMLHPTNFQQHFGDGNPITLVDTLCSIVKTAVEDPVFSVYLAAADLLRTVTFVVIPSQPFSVQQRFLAALPPVIGSVMSYCCDINKRVSTRSVDIMLELFKEPLLDPKIFAKAAFEYSLATSWRWWLGRLELAIICLAEFPSMISKLEPSSEDAIFAFMEKALENSHVKVKQTAMHLLTLSFRVASAQPSIRLKLGSFVSQLKPRIRKEVEKKLEYMDALRRYDHYGYRAKAPDTQTPVPEEDRDLDFLNDLKKEKAFQRLVDDQAETAQAASNADAESLAEGQSCEPADESSFFFSESDRPLSSKSLENVRMVEGSYKHGVHWKKGPVLGTGAFSTCFSGFDLTCGHLVAVKQVHLIRNSSFEEETLISEVCAEIRLMKDLDHPNIVRYLNCELEDNHLNIILEFVSGGSIASLLSKYGPFPEAVIKRYMKQVVAGVSYLHGEGLLHRDIKGANILVDGNGTVKVADFGASAKLKNLTTFAGEFKSLRGTPAFMAPEVIRGEGYGRKSDVWSVGAVMVEMVTGTPPWVESNEDLSNPFAIMYRIASSKEQPKLPSTLSPDMRHFILSCMRRSPDERPAASELLDHPFLK